MSVDDSSIDLSDAESASFAEKANELLQELVPVALENGCITEDDIDEFNDIQSQNLIYQGVVVPPMYNWQSEDDNLGDINLDDYIEVYFASYKDEEKKDSPDDRVFCVMLFKRNLNLMSENIPVNVVWYPDRYLQNA